MSNRHTRVAAHLTAAAAFTIFVAATATAGRAQSADIEIGPFAGGINASTYSPGSFRIVNTSATQQISTLRIDLSTGMFPDMVFDPFGTAGDVVSKPFQADSGASFVGPGAVRYLAANGGGYDVLEVDFSNFDPMEVFTFSIDIDPSSIQGVAAPGPGESGSVSGLELAGCTVAVTFSDGSVVSGETFRAAGSDTASEVTIDAAGVPAAPVLEVMGFNSPGKTFTSSWVANVTGTPGADVSLLLLEGALFDAGLPGGGFDIDPFEANSLVTVQEFSAVFDAQGEATIPFTALASIPEGGILHLMAVESDANGVRGLGSNRIVMDYDETTVAFDKTTLQFAAGSLENPTTLQFGPDDRLYVGQQFGLIKVFTVQGVGTTYQVTESETIDLVLQLPNHDDDGSLNPNVTARQITGLLVVGTAEAPVIYVTSSDPRIGGGQSGFDENVDTNSGILSMITMGASGWERTDLVRGLPRSEENHATNGMQLDASGTMLYLTSGGNTNMGAPSNNFVYLPEYALTAAILSIDLTALGNTTYDLPTLDDEDREGVVDFNDPFGGNDGKNQAILVPGGPVQIYSSGWRNAYDVVMTEGGRLYAVDNGPNAGWGAPPILDNGVATNQISEPGVTYMDSLHHIDAPGYYAGHPNPTRASTSNTFNGTVPGSTAQSPVSVGNPVESEYRVPGPASGALVTWVASTNGIAEYRSNAFGGAMRGDLLTVSLDRRVSRVKVDATGSNLLLVNKNFATAGIGSLDLTAQDDNSVFPGTIWICNRIENTITVLRPDTVIGPCAGTYSDQLDDDADGFSNADEIDNGTDPCSAASVPPDADNDLISNLRDNDDDNDGRLDTEDRFPVDPFDGANTQLPIRFLWENNQVALGGLLDLGFTGMMRGESVDYETLFDPANMTVFGAAGALTVDNVGAGTAEGSGNNQAYAFQVGLPITNNSESMTLRTRVLAPFAGSTPAADQSIGMFFGTGRQNEYAKLCVTGTGVEFVIESGDTVLQRFFEPVAMPGPGLVDLIMEIDPGTNAVRPSFVVDGQAPVRLTGFRVLPAFWFLSGETVAVGLIASAGNSPSFPATWDRLELTTRTAPHVVARVNCGGPATPAKDGQADWSADTGLFTGSTRTFKSPNPTVLRDATVPDGVPDDVVNTERFLNSGSPEMNWSIPATAGDPHVVRLYLAELYDGNFSVGARQFDVEIEGQLVLDDYDVFVEAGGGYVARVESFLITPADASIDIKLISNVENAKINAIEVLDFHTVGSVRLYGQNLGGQNDALLDVTGMPALGESVSVDVSNMGDSSVGFVLQGFAETFIPLGPFTLLVDPFILPFFWQVGLTSGMGSLPLSVPDDIGLLGRTVYVQGLAFHLDGELHFSNAAELTIGG